MLLNRRPRQGSIILACRAAFEDNVAISDLIQGSGSVCIPSLRAVKAVLRSPSSLPHRSHQLSTIIFCGGEFACIEARRLGSNLQLLAQLEDKLAAPTSIEM